MPLLIAVLLGLGVATLFARHLPIQVFATAQGLPRTSGCSVPRTDSLPELF
jgi:hypothetical protein